ncbi:uncharacterized protein STEHIDRAFT_167177 [Stereum hirsutum FP-91666 SS1]|uniref:uncharacterized protein n=1 Tax=Stereum hirsutum (strain FP-91666) TaxID=721885 RepID=UPI000440C926|nr:uncharacterized protein STEHIDRAFT_167177 [Stereum hirsutum FP-91666 SS1]EIM89369.1 hypothetical protein STEHIDRAFT_167177 [Stereum hirsutum FP-91666 SS1]
MPALPRFQASKVIQTAVPRLLQRQLAAAADFFGGGSGREGQKKALLIGITYRYNSTDIYPELHGTTSDVCELKETLINCYGFKKEDVVVLNDGNNDTMGSETWPSRTNIIAAIKALVDGAQPGDDFVFHFAGHSDQIEAKFDLNEEDGQDEVMICADLQRIIDDDIRKLLVDPLPKGSRLTAILDSCHSGTMLDLTHYGCNEFPERHNSMPFEVVVGRHEARPRRCPRRVHTVATEQEFIRRSIIPDKLSLMKLKVHAIARMKMGAKKGASRRKFSAAQLLFARSVAPRTCGSHCKLEVRTEATVISISACADHQLAYEDDMENSGSMTKSLVKILGKHPCITINELRKKLRSKFYESAFARRKRLVVYQRIGGDMTDWEDDLRDFEVQIPQIGSLTPLDPDEVFLVGHRGRPFWCKTRFKTKMVA